MSRGPQRSLPAEKGSRPRPASTATDARGTVQPKSSSRVNAAGTRLRRRLSKSFHSESADRGFSQPFLTGAGHARQEPPRKLPVAANPSVAAAHVRVIGRRILLVQLHVAQQARSRVAALEQVVAQDPILGKSAAKRALEGVDVVDSLADEGAFAEHILVDIGDGTRIRVDAGLARVQARVPRAIRAGQADAHARLQDCRTLRSPCRRQGACLQQRIALGSAGAP